MELIVPKLDWIPLVDGLPIASTNCPTRAAVFETSAGVAEG